MSAKRDGMALAEDAVNGLIDLVLAGESADEVIDGAYGEIWEGPGGGPFHIGSKVKINTTWSGKTIEGGEVTVSKGDVVSIVQPNLGEQGQDRMVLLSDGKTRVVVPYAILGEGIEEQGNGNGNLAKGPKGHEVPPAKGKLGGSIKGRQVGDAPTPEQSQPPKPTASGKPMASVQGTFQGKGKPKDAPTAQTPGQMAASSISGKAVEDIEAEVLGALDEIMTESGDNDKVYRQASELQRFLMSESDPIMYAVLHAAIFGEDNYTVESLHEVATLMQEKKKCNGKKKNGNGNNNDDDNGDDDDDDEEMEESYTEDDIEEIFQAMGQMKKQ